MKTHQVTTGLQWVRRNFFEPALKYRLAHPPSPTQIWAVRRNRSRYVRGKEILGFGVKASG